MIIGNDIRMENQIERDNSEPRRAPDGLAGLVVADTTVGGVRGQEGYFHYREHDATHLAATKTFEEVWHLLTHHHLPAADELERFTKSVTDARVLESAAVDVARSIATATKMREPLGALRTAISATAAIRGLTPWLDRSGDEVHAELLGVAASVSSLLIEMWAAVDDSATTVALTGSIARDLLAGLTGQEPPPDHVEALERYLILTMDHGFNASTFTARVIASTAADVGGAMTGAMASLSGPLHGGAPALVLDMLDEIGTPERARDWVKATLARGERIMGFGHRVYRTEDPRSALLKKTALALGGELPELAVAVEEVVLDELNEHRPERALRTNVEFYAGVVLHQIGLPQPLFTGAFAVSRAVGWSAHIAEQLVANKIIRPASLYVGPQPHAAEHAA